MVDFVGDNKLFHTILGTLESEGPIVVKTYLRKLAKSKQDAEKLEEYKRKLGAVKDTFTILRHPNIMPYQWLLLETVKMLVLISSSIEGSIFG